MSLSALSPSVMLATSMHAQPGVYAVLLGSGVSTGAGVPTGWGVVKELVRRAAAAAAPDDADSLRLAQDDPEEWWVKYGEGELGPVIGGFKTAIGTTRHQREETPSRTVHDASY